MANTRKKPSMENVNGLDREITLIKETLRERDKYMKYVLGLLIEHEGYMKKVIVLDKDIKEDIKGINDTLNEHSEYIKHFHSILNPQNSHRTSSKNRNSHLKKSNKNKTNKDKKSVSKLRKSNSSESLSSSLNSARSLNDVSYEEDENILVDGMPYILRGNNIFDEEGTFVGVLKKGEVIWK
jgi:hypothetical protein